MPAGGFRQLEVDNAIVLSSCAYTRLIVTREDVIHSWAVPSLGVKMDAIPGRLNQTLLFSKFSGVAYGQCSEICGANHSRIPIKIEFISRTDFIK